MSDPPQAITSGLSAPMTLALTDGNDVAIPDGTSVGDMSFDSDPANPFPLGDPRRNDPRFSMIGVLDASSTAQQLNIHNTANVTEVDARTVNVAMMGTDPALAEEITMQRVANTEATAEALHRQAMESNELRLKAEHDHRMRDVESQAEAHVEAGKREVQELKRQQLHTESAAQGAVDKMNTTIAHLQDQLAQARSAAVEHQKGYQGAMQSLQEASGELDSQKLLIQQLQSDNQQMQRTNARQMKEFQHQMEAMKRKNDEQMSEMMARISGGTGHGTVNAALEGIPGRTEAVSPTRHHLPDLDGTIQTAKVPGVAEDYNAEKSGILSQSSLPFTPARADDYQATSPGGDPPGPPEPEDDDDGDGNDEKKSKKDKKPKKDKKEKKKDRGRSRRRRRRDPSSSPSSSSSSNSSRSDSSERFARRIKRVLGQGESHESSSWTKSKEGDRVTIPKFPLPENYRNWRIRVRDAIVATSTRPDEAFLWAEQVFEQDQSLDALQDSGKFVTLDAKLMSAITNVVEGDMARQLDIFKEAKAKQKTHAKGRQALLMIHKHFSTSQKHGAVYDIEDLMAVQMVNDDLRGFITRWDAVIAGMTSEPDILWKQAYFHNAIKNFRPLAHDLAIYDRTPEGEPNRSYEFLMKSARDFLERKRLEKMRQATKRSLSGKRDAAAAPSGEPNKSKDQFCYAFQSGKCTRGKDCKYKHEIAPKGHGKGKKGKKGRSQSRDRSPSPGSKNQVCKFWKAGKCERGKSCAFQHPKNPAAPAREGSSGGSPDKKKKKKKPEKKKKKSRSRSSSAGSQSSKGSQSLKHQGGKPSGSAAACLVRALVMVAALRPSSSIHCQPEGLGHVHNIHREQSLAMPVSRKHVSFGSSEIEEFDVGNAEMYPYLPRERSGVSITFEQNQLLSKERLAKVRAQEDDAILAAQMLQSAVSRELSGYHCTCQFACDNDIGCKHCIRSDLKAVPGHMPSKTKHVNSEIAWIADTGSAQDLVCRSMIPKETIYHSSQPLELITANGPQSADKQASVRVDCLDRDLDPYVLPNTPAVISVGMRCILDGWEFVWRKFSRPYFRKEDGTKIKLEVKDFVPYLPSREGTVPAAVGLPFHWKTAAGNGEPVGSNPVKTRVSVPGSEYQYEDGDSFYEPSVLGDGEALGRDLTDDEDELQSFFPGELYPGPPAATTPDPHAVSDDEQGDEDVLPEVEERLVPSPAPEKRDKGEAALRAEANSLRHLMTHTHPRIHFAAPATKPRCINPPNIPRVDQIQWKLRILVTISHAIIL